MTKLNQGLSTLAYIGQILPQSNMDLMVWQQTLCLNLVKIN